MRGLVWFFGLVLMGGLSLADDSAECKGKRRTIDYTVTSGGPNSLVVNEKRVSVQKETWTKAENRAGEAVIGEEVSLLINSPTSVKTEYRFENWRHCGSVEDVRVRVYDVYPTGRVFVEEIPCECQNS